MNTALAQYKKEMEEELKNILSFWMHKTIDVKWGGFYGRIDHENKVHEEAPKGTVMLSRILWAFAAAYRYNNNPLYKQVADRAYHYITEYAIDKEYGGVYWTVDYKGQPLDDKKQIYALAFAIYGLSEYHRATGVEAAKEKAIALYRDIVQYSYDKTFGGYIEALTRDWQEINDLRLSAKDANEKKSMNTHLHVLEGFANLYRIWPDAELKQRISELIVLFLKHIISAETNHLLLFFDERWNPKSNVVSYGHDIEAAWLVQEAAEIIGDAALLQMVKERSVEVAKAAQRGLDKDGGLWYELEDDAKRLVKEKHWWPQSEAMIGFLNAYGLTGDKTFLKLSLNNWHFIKKHILDKEGGEWHWGVKEDYAVMKEDKAGLWKCPYHNSRACLEVIHHIEAVSKNIKENETI